MSIELRQSQAIDETMDKASQALVSMDYFEADRLCSRALDRAWGLKDYERMARICLPLQEARRQMRQLAADTHRCFVLNTQLPRVGPLESGCYLLEPPLLGIDGHTLRGVAHGKRVPALVLAREPLTRKGTWPIVAVGTGPTTPISIRAYVQPLEGPPTPEWFLEVLEKLGDQAISNVKPGPAVFRVEDYLHGLDALPEHEKLMQALEAACRLAITEPNPVKFRRTGFHDDEDDGSF
jgi:hypothetical protein